MSDKEREEKEKPKGGCVGRLAVLFVLVVVSGLGVAMWFMAQPQELDDIQGRSLLAAAGARDLGAVLRNSVEKGYPVTIDEREINAFIKRTLKMEQSGYLAKWVKMEGVAVRLRGSVAEVVLERSIAGRPFTVSMFLQLEVVEAADGRITKYVHRHGGPYHEMLPLPRRGGRFGKLVVPQGFLVLIWPSMESLAKVYEGELKFAGEEMTRMKIEDGKLSFDPRANIRTVPLPGGS